MPSTTYQPKPAQSKRLFAAEPEEASSSDSDSSASVINEPSVFNFGWHSIHSAAKSRFAKEAAEAGKPLKPKRVYDNSTRSAQATYDRASRSKAYQLNGVSEERLVSLMAKDTCN